MPDETIKQGLAKQGVSRRDFLKLSGLLAAAMGLHAAPVEASGLPVSLNASASGYQEQAILHAIETKQRLPVIWLEFRTAQVVLKLSRAVFRPAWGISFLTRLPLNIS